MGIPPNVHKALSPRKPSVLMVSIKTAQTSEDLNRAVVPYSKTIPHNSPKLIKALHLHACWNSLLGIAALSFVLIFLINDKFGMHRALLRHST